MNMCTASLKKNDPAGRQAFTLVELLVASTIFLILVVGAMVSVQLYGLRVYTLTTSKIKVTTGARESLNDIRDRIRTAYDVNVGTYSNGVFSTIATGQSQRGNAVQIFANTNTAAASALVFYEDVTNNVLNMVYSNTVSVEASFMTNYYCFQNEDFQGNVVTNNIGYRVITIILQFSQLAFPAGYSGPAPANVYDYYRLRTRITRRAINTQ